ncbi:CARDB domain-containing protein [Bremerella sp.]|uniref:CARDB domain-containing protein n=1 Tax=Bremerella sp. TaxID=2795602 RepID=UPI00391A47DD
MLAGDGVYFENFSTSDGLVLNGSTTTLATSDGDILRLTPALSGRNGSAFSESQVNASDFSTAFTFRITSPGGDIFDCNTTTGADGFVFVVQSVSSSIGGIGSGIGYEGIVDSVGVEFDTWCNAANWDPSSNHIGIVTEGSVNHGASAEFTAVVTPDFDDGNLWYAWVDYDGETLEVRANQTGERPAEALLAKDLDIPSVIANNTAYVGFTSATGAAWGNHDIVSWQYNSNFSPIGLVDSIVVTSPGSALQGTEQSATATVLDRFDAPVEGMPIEFEVTGANPMTISAVTDANGQATITYTGSNIGQDTIVATADSVSNTPTVLDWLPRPDLVMSSVNTPTIWQVGFNDISWTVTNVGDGTAATTWYDRVVLSTDMQYDIQDRVVASESAFHQVPLASLESYEVEYRHILSSSVAAGNYYLLYIADFGEQALEADETNNVFIQPIEVVKPDLVVETATATGTALFGNDVSVSWTVRNVGTIKTDDYISQAVWLSTDDTLNYGDIELERFPQEAGLPLAPGEGFTTTVNVPLPLSQTIRPGTYYLIVETDSANSHQEIDESNNTLATLPISISYPPLPDLIVSDISAPLEAISGQSIPISWTVTNQGDGDFQGTFRDWVSLSDDDTYGSDLFYRGFDFTGVIPAGQSITRTQLINLPDTFTGEDLRVIVNTDGWNQVLEIDAEDNNVLVADNYLDVILAAFPNLVVDEVIVPPLVSSEQEIVVEWIVSNAGTGPTNATYWDDQVYLSTDPFWDPGDYRLGTSRNPSYLQDGDSYRASLTATLPRGIDGDYYVIVLADVFNRVWEYGSENDNENSSTSFEVQLTPPPDLQVTSVQAPTSAFSGQEVQVSWTVSNEGANATNQSRWRDRVYISSDSTLSSDDVLLTTVTHDGVLAPGENYTATGFGDLPIGVSGDFFFLVEADAFDSVYEHQFENNNIAAETQATNVVLTPPPDLEVVSVVAPVTISANRQFSVSYRVENNGSTSTPNGNWTDRVYLSDDLNFNPSGDVLLDSRRHYGTLAPGEGYDCEYAGILDEDFVGEQHFYVVTDYADDVFELDNSNNLAWAESASEVVSEPGDLTVSFFSAPTEAEAGDAFLLDWSVVNSSQWETASQFWYDRVVLSTDMTVSGDDITLTSPSHAGLLQPGESYRVNDRRVQLPTNLLPGSYYLLLTTDAGNGVHELDETNNFSAAMPLEVSRIASDLRVKSVSTTDNPMAGDPLTVQWTVRNFAPVATNSNIWFDEVYLSTDYQIDSSDTLLASVQRGNPLGPNEEYSVTRAVTLPEDLSGRFFILVRTDATDLVIEGAFENNNLRVTSSEIPEGIDPSEDPVDPNDPDPPPPPEGNIQVVTVDPPDLSVVGVDAPANALSGQDFALNWTVQNIGQGDADGQWYDSVYLSLDQVFDRSSDIYLGYADRPSELAAGESYTQSETLEVPAGLAGPYYVFVIANANGRVNERGKVFNNPGYDPLSMQIDLTLPADFVVGTINVPSTGVPGAEITVGYTVENQGSNPAFGYWTDSIYLSADETWDINDPLLGRVRPNLGTLAVGASYNESLTALLPGVVPGSYHVIIRSDILNHVPEADENNNIGVSLDQADVTFPELELGVAAEGTLDAGQDIYYRVTVPAGETLSFELDSDAVDGANEIYVAYNRVPTRSDFDFTGSEPFGTDQSLIVPRTQEGIYYVLVRSLDQNASPQQVSVLASLPEFSLTGIAPQSLGNVGSATLQIQGVRLSLSTQVFLVLDDREIPATRLFFQDSTAVFATFDLTNVPLGLYSLRADDPLHDSATLSNTLEIVAGRGADLSLELSGPSVIRVNQVRSLQLQYANRGDTDLDTPLIILRTLTNTPFGLSSRDLDTRPIQFFGGSKGGPSNIMLPGQTEQRNIFFQSDSASINFDVTSITSEDPRPIDWQLLTESIRPSTISDSDWEANLVKLQDYIGATWGEYVQQLQQASLRLALRGEQDVNVERLFDFIYQQALGNAVGYVGGEVIDASTGEPVSAGVGVQLQMTGGDTPVVRNSHTDAYGSFYFDTLPTGTYLIRVAGTLNPATSITIGDPSDVADVTLDADFAAVGNTFDGLPTSDESYANALTFDDQGNRHLLVVRDGVILYSSYDSLSNSYRDPIEIPGAFGRRPQMVFAKDLGGTVLSGLFVIWKDEAGNYNYTIGTSGGPVNGWTFASPQELESSPSVSNPGAAYVQLLVESNGNPAVLWTDFSRNGNPKYLSQWNGDRWGTALPLDGTLNLQSPANVAARFLFDSEPGQQIPSPTPYDGTFGDARYYRFRHQDFLNRFCGGNATGCAPGVQPPDYYLDYGDKYLNEFANDRDNYSPEGQAWIDRTRAELQKQLEQGLLNDPSMETDSQRFRDFAFDTHPDAYIKSGLFDLPWSDYWEIVWTTGEDSVFTTEGWEQIWDVGVEYLDTMYEDLSTTLEVIGNDITDALRNKFNELKDITQQIVDELSSWGDNLRDITEDSINYLKDLRDRFDRKADEIREELKKAADDAYDDAKDAFEKLGCLLGIGDCEEDDPNAPDPPPNEDDPNRDGYSPDVVQSLDPNDILGPEGFGPENFIAATDPLAYTIRFENDPIFATAPAQTVRITQQLDADLDFRSFRLGDFGIGTQVFEVPDNRAFYVDRLDLTAELGILVDVFAGVDIARGEAFWEFTSIDPATGDAPTDALAGFLPPNLISPEGEGFVTYSIKASPDAVTGDVIDAEARIIFDTNEPIDTPPIFHTLDVDAPSSHVDALPISLDKTKFELSWSGQDAAGGSGVAKYDIYVSKNGGVYQPFLVGTTLTTAPFVGHPGNHYAFYSVAHDYAGNVEVAPTVADSTTTITNGVSTLGDAQLLVSLTRTDETSPVGTSRTEPTTDNIVFHEWESIVAQVWITVTPEMASGPISLEAGLTWESELFLEPEALEHLGANLDISSENGSTNIWWDNIDLSEYQEGHRVLIANLLIPVDRQNAVGISSQVVGQYPTVTQQDAFQLTSGRLGRDGQLLNSYPHINVPIAPVVYDSDDSGHVGLGDFAQFIRNYGRMTDPDKFPEAFRYDFNQDGRVGLTDFAKFIQHYGQRKYSDNVTIRMPALIPEASGENLSLRLEEEPTSVEPLLDPMRILPLTSHYLNAESGSDLRVDKSDDFKSAPYYLTLQPSVHIRNAPDVRLLDAIFQTLELEFPASGESGDLIEIDASLLSDLADEWSQGASSK